MNLTLKTTIVSMAFLVCGGAYNLLRAQQIVPMPTSMEAGSGRFRMADGTALYTNLAGKDRKTLAEYVAHTVPVTLKKGDARRADNIIKLICTQKNDNTAAASATALQGYKLSVTPREIVIEAPSAMGLFYGWQSVRQLMSPSGEVNAVTVTDEPRFAYRGVMLDCSRHFWTTAFIKKQIDLLAYFKMDRLHLHLTDAAGWRMEMKRYPELTQKAAYRTFSDWNKWWDGGIRKYCTKDEPGAYGGYYTQAELKDIVQYAATRHITVIPEVEMPGHSEEVTYAYPHLSCSGQPYTSGDFCVGNEETFVFLENVLREVMAIFPSEYIHIGGDEASRRAWETCPKCQKRMKDEGLKTTAELQSYLTRRIEKFLNANGRQLLGWDEILEGELAPNASVMSWRGTEGGLKAAKMGHTVIMTPGQYCYLDAYQDAPPTQPVAFGGYTPLDKTYSYDPVPQEIKGTDSEKYIYGVQANLWTELIKTPEHVEYMLYPRVLAIAEVGWSRNKSDYNNFKNRVMPLLDGMRAQGFNPFDLRKEAGHRPASVTPIVHEAVGKKVAYITPYAEGYKGQGEASLTNGYQGDWNYNDGQWQGYIGKGYFEAVVDMDSITDIRNVEIEFMQFKGPEVFYPSQVVISVSEDGQNYTDVCTKNYPFDEEGYFIRPCVWNGSARGRYVRCHAKASEKAGWIFTNEIIVNKK